MTTSDSSPPRRQQQQGGGDETTRGRVPGRDPLFGDAAALMRRGRGLRQELEDGRTSSVEETERLVHVATVAGIEAGLMQGLEAALRALREAQAAGGVPPAWLRSASAGEMTIGRTSLEVHSSTEAMRLLSSTAVKT